MSITLILLSVRAIVLILVVMEYTQWETLQNVVWRRGKVLILVVMEYTQWVMSHFWKIVLLLVLILVVMEYTQWDENYFLYFMLHVLILVVMEYTQWEKLKSLSSEIPGLNPCCNGIYSMSLSSRIPDKNNKS